MPSRLRSLLIVDRWSIAAFWVALALGLAGLALAGRVAAGRPLFEQFTRFHEQLGPATFFYPTASEVVALARASARPGQIPVIVGGSSIVYGWGQGTDEVWTDRLQAQLGDRFSVLNLALPFGAPGEHGGVAAQALAQDGRAPIFIAEVFPAGTFEPDGDRFRYVFWDAWTKGLLPAVPERDALLAQPSANGRAVDDERRELRLRSALDRTLYFTDFWQTVSYRWLFTLWYPASEGRQPFLTPRAQTADPRATITPAMRYPSELDTRALETLTREVAAWCSQQPDGAWVLADDAPFWARYEPWLRATFPPGLRERSILLVIAHSPYYAERQPEPARRCWLSAYARVTERLTANGYHAIFLSPDWTADDFIDLLHPSGAGGQKMAERLAPLVRKLAEQSPAR